MSNPTSNFNWQMPTNTDLVSQLPADFEVFGQAVDTSLADLKGGTTGQVLKKNSNTDMDFVWGADSAGMTNPMTTTGDTIYSSSGSTPARLGIGTAGQVLRVNSGATAPEWATPASGGKVLQVVQGTITVSTSTTSSSFVDSGLTATITPSSTSSRILVLVTMPSGQMSRSGAATGNYGEFKLVRGATNLSTAGIGTLNYASSSGQAFYNSPSFSQLDSPSTTSATTYKVQYSTSTTNGTIYVHDGTSGTSAIILMEIGA
jgi:hypothetical protein